MSAGLANGFQTVAGRVSPSFLPSAGRVTARVTLPARSAGSFHLEDAETGAGVDVALKEVKDVEGQIEEGFVIYSGAHASGATVLQRPGLSGNEDFVSFETRPQEPTISYEMTLGPKVAGLRLVANTLEMVDAGGAPRLRVAPPYIVGADGARADATLAVRGCAVDGDPSAPWGRRVTAPGAASCTVRVSWNNAAVVYPAVLDPSWTTTTNTMVSARQDHTATLMTNGVVLVAGGRTSNTSTTGLATAELYNPSTGLWAATGTMAGTTPGRYFHSATQLGSTSNSNTTGKVLIVGGRNAGASLGTAQLYSPSAGTWLAVSVTLSPTHEQHTATLLANGQVLVVGGVSGTTPSTAAATYNPAGTSTGSWTGTTALSPGRRGHTATLLVVPGNATLNNKVLVVGGNSGGTTSLGTTLLFDSTAGWTNGPALPSSATLEAHTATVLANGNVLVTGGHSGTGSPLTTARLFNPSTGSGSWTSTGSMQTGRQAHTATLLPAGILANGQVLVAGGSNGSVSQSTAELWNGSTWALTTALPAAVQGQTATLLPNNRVLIAGGMTVTSTTTTTANTARLYDPSIGLTCTTNSQCGSGFCANGVCCNSACNGGCGACNLPGLVGTCSPVTSGTTCRASAGTCDVAETCNGTALTCPTDAFAAATTTCRAAAGTCDVAEKCTGTSAACPADAFIAATTVCRASAGTCDVAETCTGTSAACPTDTFAPATTTCRAVAGTCDVAEKCTGTAAACPADGFLAAATVCRVAAGTCDVAETCTGSSAACPADALAPVTTVCRPANGACDVAETCTGTSTACPADGFVPATTVCRGSAGTCDVAETCTGSSAACPTDTFAPATTTCRAVAGTCDVAEKCTGTAAACPADGFLAAATVCRASAGACDVAETCSGTSAACPADALATATTVCRPANGGCDVAETCTGSSTACPADGFAAATTVCRASAGICDVAETCPGTSAACPTDTFALATTTCRAAAGTCDVAEKCTGAAAACPADGFLAATTVCRAAAGLCDVAETCTGSSGACPADALAPATTVCRPANGACDVAETCTGTSTACPVDVIALALTVCRPANGACDVAETCTGSSTACPADGLAPATTVCRAANGVCDVAESCTGTSAACPTDAFASATTVCRAANGACDVAEKCTGTGTACPVDGFLAAATICRTATDGCDAAESCTGSSPGCPTDNKLPNNSFCTDGNLCTVNDRCQGGVCVPGPNVTCPGDFCHAAGTCDPATGFCANTAPINEGLSCDDGNRCTVTSQCKLGVCVPEDPVTGCTGPGDAYYAPLTNLGSRQGVSVANDINNHGVVAGTDVHFLGLHEFAFSGEGLGFSWTAEGGFHQLPRPAGKQVSSWAISDNGEIVGTAWNMEVPSPGANVYHYDPVTDQAQGSQTAGWGMAINASGQFTGESSFPGIQGYTTFRAQGATFQQIANLSGFVALAGRAIDASGNIFGNFQRASASAPLVAMRYTDALGFQYLNQLLPAGSDWDIDPVLGGDFLTSANGTNGAQIVGTGQSGNGKTRGFVLTPGPAGAPGSATIKRIDLPAGTTDDTAHVVSPYRINAAGQVVGTIADISNGPQRAFIWSDGVGTIDLNKYVDPNSGWVLQSALGINDGVNGRPEVVGDGLFNGQKRGFKMRMPDLRACPAVDACHGPGVRDARTGVCSSPILADGTTCNDGSACTSGDHCQAGACVGTTAVACPGDACRPAGVCDPSSGFCSIPAPYPGSPSCDDGNRCTIGDFCNLGTCMPGPTDNGCRGPTDTFYVPVIGLGSTQGSSLARGINNDGVVVGHDSHLSTPTPSAVHVPSKGFRWTEEGGIQVIPAPANTYVFPAGISTSGVVAGSTVPDPGEGSRVFRYDPSVDTQLQILPIQNGVGNGINDAGQIAGFAYFPQGLSMYRATGNTIQTIPGPTGDQYQYGNAIDPLGTVLGNTYRANSTWAAIMYSDALGLEYLNQMVPGGSDWNLDPLSDGDYLAYGYGSNGHQIVGGGHSGSGALRGFVLTPGADGSRGSGTIKKIDMIRRFPLDDPNYYLVAHAINSAGEVVGGVYDWSVSYSHYAFIWVEGTGTVELNELIDPASGWTLNVAYAINDKRQVVGYGSLNGQTRAFMMNVPDLSPCPPVDTCHGPGIRDLRTGQCSSSPVLADGTSCSDGNACTPNDVCQAGNCVGGPLDVVCAVAPAVEGVTTLNGQQVAVFSYNNSGNQNTNIPYGPQNFLTPPGSDQSNPPASPPPTWFLAGQQRGAFTSPLVNGALSWTVGSKTVMADGSSFPMTPETHPDGTGVTLADGTFVILVSNPAPDIAAAILPSGATSDATDTAGMVDGRFGVTDDGAATYHIPLWVPDGVAGMQPHLSLAYSSRAGDGPLGVGWQIGGLSTITRCHDDYARDGDTKPIKFTNEDKLCLDGERLVWTGGGANMTATAEYRTEHDKFIKVLQVGADDQGPTGFLVYYPDGTRSSFGSDPNATTAGFHGDPTAVVAGYRIIVNSNPQDATVQPTIGYEAARDRFSWALASSRDRFNNEVTYTYGNFGDALEGTIEYLPVKIEYNFKPGATTGDRTVEFDWGVQYTDDRKDVRRSYVGGLAFKNSRLLRSITMKGPDPVTPSQLRLYRLGYRDSAGVRAQLRSVTECDRGNTCKAPITFQWTDIDMTFEKVPVGLGASPSRIPSLIPADINGDGRDDLIFAANENQWAFAIAGDDGRSFGPIVSIPYNPSPISSDIPAEPGLDFSGRAADLNMDGLADFLYPRVINPAGTSGTRLLRSTGTGFIPFETTETELSKIVGSRFNADYVGDFTGDGLPDIMRAIVQTDTAGDVGVWGLRPNSQFGGLGPYQTLQKLSPGANQPIGANAEWNAYALDTDGDGKLEFVFRDARANDPDQSTTARMLALTPLPTDGTGASSLRVTSLIGSGKHPGEVRYQMADVNGDGLADAIEIPNNGGNTIRIAINNGREFMPPTSFQLPATRNVGQSVDLAVPHFSVAAGLDPGIRVMDYNLDGRADLFLMDEGCFNQGTPLHPSDGDAVTPTRFHPTALMPRSDSFFGSSGQLDYAEADAPVGNPVEPVFDEFACYDHSDARVLDVNGDGLSDFVQIEGSSFQPFVYLRRRDPAGRPDLLKTITDSLGHQVKVEYKPITDSTVHTKVQCSYPQSCNPRGMWVVSKQTMDATGTPLTYSHHYQGARSDLQGIGWLGMDQHTVKDDTDTTGRSSFLTTTFYDHVNKGGSNIYPYAEKPFRTVVTAGVDVKPDPALASRFVSKISTQTYRPPIVSEDGARVVLFPDELDYAETEYLQAAGIQLSSSVNKTWRLVTNYNQQYGYLTSKGLVIGGEGGEEEDVDYTFLADNPEQWLIGLKTQEKITYRMPGRTDVMTPDEQKIRTTTLDPDPLTGALRGFTREDASGDATLRLVTQFSRNGRGQIYDTKETATDPLTGSPTIRESVIDDFDPVSGIYPYHVRNAKNQPSVLIYHAGLGVLVQAKDPNQLVLKRRFDGFGRLRGEDQPSGVSFAQTYGSPVLGPFTGIQVDIQQAGGDESTIYDQNGNDLIVSRRDENGGYNRSTSQYDAYGRRVARWRPYPVSAIGSEATLPHGTYRYDILGRLLEEDLLPARKSCGYVGNTTRCTTRTNPNWQDPESDDLWAAEESLVDQAGRLVQRDEWVGRLESPPTSAHAVTTRYVYGPFGTLRHVIDATGNTITTGNVTHMEYDVLGRRVSMSDPDSGLQSDIYDAFGQLRQTNSHGQIVQVDYDGLGRRLGELTTEGGSVASVFTWDASPNGIGQISSHGSPDGVTAGFEYDSKGRPSAETWSVAGAPRSYRLDVEYDGFGRPGSMTYPTISGARYQAVYGYTSSSNELLTITAGDGGVLWVADARNPERNILHETFGDGVTSTRGYEPERGYLQSIVTLNGAQFVQNLGFDYDAAGFMTFRANYIDGEEEIFSHDELGRLTHWGGPSGGWSVDYQYDDIGNMTTRTSVQPGGLPEVRTFTPGGPALPHGVTSVAVPGSPAELYVYDAAGRQTHGPDRTVGYTDFDLPRSISKAGATWVFKYDANHRRAAKQGPSGATFYLGGLFEVRTTPGGVATNVMYIPGESGIIAQATQVDGAPSPKLEYLHGDHVGSTNAVTGRDGPTVSVTQMRFDPFGTRIGTSGPPMSLLPSLSPAPDVTKGFAAHEEDDELGLINMGGRIYDPALARFLTPDPLVSRPWKSQSFNRYSYVENSPLKRWDPSGFDGDDVEGGDHSGSSGVPKGSAHATDCPLPSPGPTHDTSSPSGGNAPPPEQAPPGPSTATAGSAASPAAPTPSSPPGGGGPVDDSSPSPNSDPVPPTAPPPPSSPGQAGSPVVGAPPQPAIDRESQKAQEKWREAGKLAAEARAVPGGVMLPPAIPPNADIIRNISQSRDHFGDLIWFALQVRPGGPWDYKQEGRQYEHFGNWHFGVTGRALGVPREMLMRAAGLVQIHSGTSHPLFGNPFLGTRSNADDPVDAFWIGQGMDFYDHLYGGGSGGR